jgi:integrase
MPKYQRFTTDYPAVYYLEGKALDGRPEKIFYISYYRQGKRIEEKAGRQFRDKMTAARANQIRTRRIEGTSPSNQERRQEAQQQQWTLGRLWAEYSEPLPRNTKNFITDFGRYKNYLQSALGRKEPRELSPMDVHRLRIKLSKDLKPQTVKHVLLLLQRLINFGVKKGLCPGITFKIEMPKVDNKKTEYLTAEQLRALTAAIDAHEWEPQAANFMRLVLYTGMRRGEIFKLQWQDLDFDRGFITIRAPKGGKEESIPLNQAAREVLANHPRVEDSPFVFPGRGGRQRTRPPKLIEAIREQAGLPADFRPLHGLRHSYASMLASSGRVDLYTLQKLLTHKSPAMTMRYAHLRDEALKGAAALAGELIDQAVNGEETEVAGAALLENK